jgi:hypothetical protein
VDHEIRHRHLAGQNERDRARQQTEQEKRATHNFEDPSQAEERHEFDGRARRHRRRHREQLLCAVCHERKRGHDAQHAA